KSCQQAQGDGSFNYQPSVPAPGLARSAAAVRAWQLQGIGVTRDGERALAYLLEDPNNEFVRRLDAPHFYYGHFYAAEVMWAADSEIGAKWYARIRNVLLHRMAKDHWTDRIDDHYATAIALIVLQLPTSPLTVLPPKDEVGSFEAQTLDLQRIKLVD